MSAYSDLMLSTSPVAYWRFGEPSGTTAADSSGNGHNGTYTGGPTLGQPGLIVDLDTAALFDGSNDRVTVPQDPALQIAGALTVQAWVRPEVAEGLWIVHCGDADAAVDRYFALRIGVGGFLGFSWKDAAGFKNVDSAAGLIVPGNTYHVVATRDAGLYIRLYLNGTLVGEGQGTAPTGSPDRFLIGVLGEGPSAQQFFNGRIDEVAVHNVALTPEQVADLHDMGVNPPPPPPSAYRDLLLSTAPVAYWRFGETAGTVAADSSGNGHPGTYVNGPVLGQPGLIADTDTAVFFDGSNDHVAVPQHADLKLPGAVTVQAWIRPATLTAADIVRQGLVTDVSYLLELLANGAVRFLWYDGAFKNVGAPAGTITAGNTYHVAATRDASLFVRLYVDGVQVASGQGTAPTVDPVAMQISGAFASRFFPGLIDEVAVHNVALTPTQVADLYELGLNGPPPPPPPPPPPSGGGVTRPARRYHRMGRGVTR